MDKINYWEIFKKAWTVTWHHKYLWWLGLFAGSGAGMGFNFTSGIQKETETNNTIWAEKVAPFIESHLALVIGLAVLAIFLIVLLALLKILAFSGLIRAIFGINKGEIKTLREVLREGKKYFVRVLGIRILFAFLILALILVLALPVIFLFSTQSYILGSLTALMAFIILIPALVTFSFIAQYGSFYVLTSDLSIKASLEQGYKIFAKNIGSSLIMSLLFIPVSIIAGLITIIPIIIMTVISVFFGIILYQFLATMGVWIVGSIAVVLFLILVLFTRSVLSVFTNTAWFLFFKEIATVKKEEIKVEDELVIESEIQPEKA